MNTNGNHVSWATYTQELGDKDIVKLGDGMLTINTIQGGTFAGAITVSGGTLFYNIGDNSVTRTWSGNIPSLKTRLSRYRTTVPITP